MVEQGVFLVRHGMHDWLLPGQNRLAGTMPGVGLNAQGRNEAAHLAEVLAPEPLHWVVVSPLQRTIETAEVIIRRHGLDLLIDERFIEWRLGPWDGMWIEEIRSRYADEWRIWREKPDQLRLPGAETLWDVADRMQEGFRDCVQRGSSGVIVSHQDPLAALICRLMGMPLARIRAFEIQTGSLSRCLQMPYGTVVASINTTGKLES